MITLTATDIFMTTMTKNIDVCIDTTSKESRQWSLYQVVLLSMPDLKWVSVFWQLWPPYWCSISCTAMHPMATYYSTTVQHPSQMAFFSGIEKDLIIFQRIGSEWQSNDCVDTNHHFCLLQACELAEIVYRLHSEVVFLRKEVLTQSWEWSQCWRCNWHWRPRTRDWAPSSKRRPPGRWMCTRTGLSEMKTNSEGNC